MNAVISKTLLPAALACALAAPTSKASAQETAGGLKATGHLAFSVGVQDQNPDSIFPPEGSQTGTSLVSRKTSAVLKLSKPGGYSAVLDAQYDDRPYSSKASRVNQFYAAFDLSSRLRVRVGKQRVLWGRGFIYVPTDFVNPPLDPSGLDLAKVGVPAVSADYVGDTYSVTALVRSERSGIDSAGVKYSPGLVSGLDLDFIAYHAPSIGNALGASMALDAEQLIAPGLAGLVLHGGLAVHTRSRYPALLEGTLGGTLEPPAGPQSYPMVGPQGRRGRYYSVLAGATYQVSNTLLLLGEYYRIGDAYTGSQFDRLNGALTDRGSARQAASMPWLNHWSYGRNQRNYLNVSVNKAALTEGANRFTDTFGVEVAVLRNLDENSGMTSLALLSNYWDRTEVSLRAFLPQGKRTTEFGTTPYKWYVEFGIKIGF